VLLALGYTIKLADRAGAGAWSIGWWWTTRQCIVVENVDQPMKTEHRGAIEAALWRAASWADHIMR